MVCLVCILQGFYAQCGPAPAWFWPFESNTCHQGGRIWKRHTTTVTGNHAEIAPFEYINGVYNPRHKQSALGWKSPVAFEQLAA